MSESQTITPVYDRLISESAVLKCVLAALESRDVESTGPECKLASAELALRHCIGRLEDLYGDAVYTLEHQARRDVTERVATMLNIPVREVAHGTR